MKKSAKIIAAATLSSMLLTGCNTAEPDFKEPTPTATVDPADTNDTDYNVMGIVPAIEGGDSSFVAVDPPEIEEEPILMGDVPYVPEDENDSFVTVDPPESEEEEPILMGEVPYEPEEE